MAQLELEMQLNWSISSSEEVVGLKLDFDEAREIKVMQGCISGS
jgi:hypothetical protein